MTVTPLSSMAALAVAIGRRDHSANASIGSAARRSCSTNARAPATRNTAPRRGGGSGVGGAQLGEAGHRPRPR